MDTDKIIACARELIGTPWLHQGRSKEGCDCVYLYIYPCQVLGIDHMDCKTYPYMPQPKILIERFKEQPKLERICVSKLAPGDIILMDMGAGAQHVAMYTGESIIHAFNNALMQVVEHRLCNRGWRKKLHSVWRFID